MIRSTVTGTVLALCGFALFPAALSADANLDDLDATMIVLDDAADLRAEIAALRNPRDRVDEDDQRAEELLAARLRDRAEDQLDEGDEGDGPTAVLFADDDHRGADFEPVFGGGDSAAGLELDDDFELAEEIDDDRPVDAP